MSEGNNEEGALFGGCLGVSSPDLLEQFQLPVDVHLCCTRLRVCWTRLRVCWTRLRECWIRLRVCCTLSTSQIGPSIWCDAHGSVCPSRMKVCQTRLRACWTQWPPQIGPSIFLVHMKNCLAQRNVMNRHFDQISFRNFLHGPLCGGGEGRCKAPWKSWKREFKLPWREAGPPNHPEEKVDFDQ